jgi:hypothetical protein
MDAKGAAKMTRRYKGRPSAKTIARDFPFIVELAVPLGGYGKKLNLMHSFHDQRGIQVAHVRHRHEDDRDFTLWCFARRAIAEGFAAEFGGSLQRKDHREPR